jgi:hypothetical protein
MGADCFVEELKYRALLQTQRLHDRQDALHEPAAVGAVAAERAATPQHCATLRPLDMVVGRFDTFYGHERPQREKIKGSGVFFRQSDSEMTPELPTPLSSQNSATLSRRLDGIDTKKKKKGSG